MQDFSAYRINADKRLKESDLLLLKHKYSEAKAQIDEAIVELRMTKAAITVEEEKHERTN